MQRSSVPNARRSSLRSGCVLDWTISPIKEQPEETQIKTADRRATPHHDHQKSILQTEPQPSPGMANLSADILHKGLMVEQGKMSSTPNLEEQKGKKWRSKCKKETSKKPTGRKLLSSMKISVEQLDPTNTGNILRKGKTNSVEKTADSTNQSASKTVEKVTCINIPEMCKKKQASPKKLPSSVDKSAKAKPCNKAEKLSASIDEAKQTLKRNVSTIACKSSEKHGPTIPDDCESHMSPRSSPRKCKTSLPPIDVCTLPISKEKICNRTKKTNLKVPAITAREPRKRKVKNKIESGKSVEKCAQSKGDFDKIELVCWKSNRKNSYVDNRSKRKTPKQSKSSSRRNYVPTTTVMGSKVNATTGDNCKQLAPVTNATKDITTYICANLLNTDFLENYVNQIDDFDKRFPEINVVSEDMLDTVKISLNCDMTQLDRVQVHHYTQSTVNLNSSILPSNSNSSAGENDSKKSIFEDLPSPELQGLLNDIISKVEQELCSGVTSFNKVGHRHSPYNKANILKVSVPVSKPFCSHRKRKYSQISVSTKIKEINDEPPCKRQKLQSEFELNENVDTLQRTNLKEQAIQGETISPKDVKVIDSNYASSAYLLKENVCKISFSTPDHSIESSEEHTSPLFLSKRSQSNNFHQQGQIGKEISDSHFASESSEVPVSKGDGNRRKRKTKIGRGRRKQKINESETKVQDSSGVDSTSTSGSCFEINQKKNIIKTNLEISSHSDKLMLDKSRQTNKNVVKQKSNANSKPKMVVSSNVDDFTMTVKRDLKLSSDSDESLLHSRPLPTCEELNNSTEIGASESFCYNTQQDSENSEVLKRFAQKKVNNVIDLKTNGNPENSELIKQVDINKSNEKDDGDSGSSSTKASSPLLKTNHEAVERDLEVSPDSEENSLPLSLLKIKPTVQTAKTKQPTETFISEAGVKETKRTGRVNRKKRESKKTLKLNPIKSDDQSDIPGSSDFINSDVHKVIFDVNQEQKDSIEKDLEVSSDSDGFSLPLPVSDINKSDNVTALSQQRETGSYVSEEDYNILASGKLTVHVEKNMGGRKIRKQNDSQRQKQDDSQRQKQDDSQRQKQDDQSLCALDNSSANENIEENTNKETFQQENCLELISSGSEDISNNTQQLCSAKFVSEDCQTEGKDSDLSIASPFVSQFSSPLSISSPFSGFESDYDIFSTQSDIQVSETIHRYSGINLQVCVHLEKLPDKKKFSVGNLVLTKRGRKNQCYWKIKENNVSNEISAFLSEAKVNSSLQGTTVTNVEISHENLVMNKEDYVDKVLTEEEKVTQNVLSDAHDDNTCPSSSYYVCASPNNKATVESVPDKRKIPLLRIKRKTMEQPFSLTDFELAITRPHSDSKIKKKPREALKRAQRKGSDDSIPEDSQKKRSLDKIEKTPVDIKKLPKFSGPLKSKIAQNILRKKAEEDENKQRPETFHVENPISFLEMLQSSQSASKSSGNNSVTITAGSNNKGASKTTSDETNSEQTGNKVKMSLMTSSALSVSSETCGIPSVKISAGKFEERAHVIPNKCSVHLEKPVDQLTETSSVSKEKVLKEFDEFMSEMTFIPLYEEDSDEESDESPRTTDALSGSDISFEGSKPKIVFGRFNTPDSVSLDPRFKNKSIDEKPNFFCGLNIKSQGFLNRPVEKLSIQDKQENLDEIGSEPFSLKDNYFETNQRDESSMFENMYNDSQNIAYVTIDKAECSEVKGQGNFFISYEEEESSIVQNPSNDTLNSAYVTIDQADCSKVSNKSSISNDSFDCVTLDEVTVEEPSMEELGSPEPCTDNNTAEERDSQEQEHKISHPVDEGLVPHSPGELYIDELETGGLSDLEEVESVSKPYSDQTYEQPEQCSEPVTVDQSVNQALHNHASEIRNLPPDKDIKKKRRSWRKSQQSPEKSDSSDSDDDAVSIYAPSEASFLFDKDIFSSPEAKPGKLESSFLRKSSDLSTHKDLSKSSDRINQNVASKDNASLKPPSESASFKIPIKKPGGLLSTPTVRQDVDQSARDPPKIPFWACPQSFFSLPELQPMGFCSQFLKSGVCPRNGRCSLIHKYVKKEEGFECAVSLLNTFCRTGQLDNAMKAFNSVMLVGKPPDLNCYALLELCCNRGAVNIAMDVLNGLCSHQFLSQELNNNLIDLFAKKKPSFREHLNKVVNATLLLNIPLCYEPLMKLLRLYKDEKDWKEFWRMIDYCKGKFPVPNEIQAFALEAVTQDPAKWLPLAKNYIESRQVEDLIMISTDILKKLNEECQKSGYKGCSQLLSKVNSTLMRPGDPRRNPDARSCTGNKAPLAIPLNNPVDVDRRIKICLAEIITCSIVRNWENLGNVFVRQCTEGVDFHNPILLKGYVDCLAKQENVSAISNSFNNFVRAALEKADHERSRAYINEKFLAKIGLELMGMFYKQTVWQSGYEVVFTLHDTRLEDHMLEATDSDSRIGFIMAINICLHTGQHSFALQIIQRCLERKMSKFLSSALALPEFNLCFKLLKDLLLRLCSNELNRYISSLMDKILGNCPRLTEETNLHQTEELVCGLITKLLTVNVRHAEDLFQKAISHNLTIFPPVCRALLVACFQKGTSQMVQAIYLACKQCNVYPRQSPEDINRCLLMDVTLSGVEMKLVVEDYLFETFLILCKKLTSQEKLEEEDFELDIVLKSGMPRGPDLPFLSSMLPGSLQESQRTLISILQDKLHLEAEVIKSRIVSVVPASLKSYMTLLGQHQGIRFDIPGRAPVPVRGRPPALRPPLNIPLETGPGPCGDAWSAVAGPSIDHTSGRGKRGIRGGRGRFNRGFRGRWQ